MRLIIAEIDKSNQIRDRLFCFGSPFGIFIWDILSVRINSERNYSVLDVYFGFLFGYVYYIYMEINLKIRMSFEYSGRVVCD